MSTVKAAFGGWVPPINPDQGSTIPCCFIFKLGHKLRPSNIADSLCKAVIFDHVLDSETLNADRLVFTDQACRELMEEVRTSVSNLGMDTRHFETGLVSVLGTSLLFGMATLGLGKLLFIFREEFGIADRFTIGEYHEGFQAKISPYGCISLREMGDLVFHQDAHEVAICTILGNGATRGLGTIRQGTRPADSQRVLHLGKGHFPIPVNKGRTCIRSRLLFALLMEYGIVPSSFKEVDERLIQMSQCLLQGDRGNIREPCVAFLLFQVRQGCAQIVVVQTDAILIVGVRSFAQCPIVDEPATPKGLGKYFLLFVGWVEPVSVGSLLFHVLQYSSYLVKRQWVWYDPTQPARKEGP